MPIDSTSASGDTREEWWPLVKALGWIAGFGQDAQLLAPLPGFLGGPSPSGSFTEPQRSSEGSDGNPAASTAAAAQDLEATREWVAAKLERSKAFERAAQCLADRLKCIRCFGYRAKRGQSPTSFDGSTGPDEIPLQDRRRPCKIPWEWLGLLEKGDVVLFEVGTRATTEGGGVEYNSYFQVMVNQKDLKIAFGSSRLDSPGGLDRLNKEPLSAKDALLRVAEEWMLENVTISKPMGEVASIKACMVAKKCSYRIAKKAREVLATEVRGQRGHRTKPILSANVK